jgi:hypothetical protein
LALAESTKKFRAGGEFVLATRASTLHGEYDTGRLMHEAHRGRVLIAVLTTGATPAIVLHAEVPLVDIEVGRLFSHNGERRRTGVATTGAVITRDALYSMDTNKSRKLVRTSSVGDEDVGTVALEWEATAVQVCGDSVGDLAGEHGCVVTTFAWSYFDIVGY